MNSRPGTDTDPAPAGAMPRILLVEDNAADIGLVREALLEHSVRCELTVITDGEHAIAFIDDADAGKHACPDLIILDLNLPKKPGKEVLSRIRSSTVCRDAKVIVLTSSDSQKDRDDVATLRPSLYIRKPSKLDEFLHLGAVFRDSLHPAG